MTKDDIKELGSATLFYPNLTKADIMHTYSFDGRIEKVNYSTVDAEDFILFIFATTPRLECIMVGEGGYFESRLDRMPVYGECDDMAKHLFAILNGDLVIDGPSKINYPQHILEYARFHAMCKRDAKVEADRLAMAAKHQGQVGELKTAHLAEIEELKAAQQKNLALVDVEKQELTEKLARSEEHVNEKTLAVEKLSEALAERDSELAKKHKALRSARQQMALIMAEYNELQRESGVDAPTAPATMAGSDIGSTTDVDALSDDSSETPVKST